MADMAKTTSSRPGKHPARAKATSAPRKPARKSPPRKSPARKCAKAPAKRPAATTRVSRTRVAKTAVAPTGKTARAATPARVKSPTKLAPATTPRSSAAGRKPAAAGPVTAAERRRLADKREAAVAARRATLARTRFNGDLSTVKVDPGDEAAVTALSALTRGPVAGADTAPSARIKRSATARAEAAAKPADGVLIDRVSRSIERELGAIERIIGVRAKRGQRTETERRARTLASLARTLAELRKLRSERERTRPRDDDAIPRDLDELRRALSRRLDQMVAGGAQLPAAGDE